MVVGRVSALWRYPVKSLRGESLEFAPIGPAGIPGDRGIAVVDRESGRVISGKRVGALLGARAVARPGGPVLCLPDGRAFCAGDAGADAALSEWLGRPVLLRRTPDDDRRPLIESEENQVFLGRPGGFHDSMPLHLLTTATLSYLHALHPGGAWDARRFRPNVLIECDGASPVEQDWIGHALRVGSVELDVAQTCTRCVMTTLPQDELPHDPDILRTVAREQDNKVGVKASVRTPGAIALGDQVTIE